jgi:hypothetical protein
MPALSLAMSSFANGTLIQHDWLLVGRGLQEAAIRQTPNSGATRRNDR